MHKQRVNSVDFIPESFCGLRNHKIKQYMISKLNVVCNREQYFQQIKYVTYY